MAETKTKRDIRTVPSAYEEMEKWFTLASEIVEHEQDNRDNDIDRNQKAIETVTETADKNPGNMRGISIVLNDLITENEGNIDQLNKMSSLYIELQEVAILFGLLAGSTDSKDREEELQDHLNSHGGSLLSPKAKETLKMLQQKYKEEKEKIESKKKKGFLGIRKKELSKEDEEKIKILDAKLIALEKISVATSDENVHKLKKAERLRGLNEEKRQTEENRRTLNSSKSSATEEEKIKAEADKGLNELRKLVSSAGDRGK